MKNRMCFKGRVGTTPAFLCALAHAYCLEGSRSFGAVCFSPISSIEFRREHVHAHDWSSLLFAVDSAIPFHPFETRADERTGFWLTMALFVFAKPTVGQTYVIFDAQPQ